MFLLRKKSVKKDPLANVAEIGPPPPDDDDIPPPPPDMDIPPPPPPPPAMKSALKSTPSKGKIPAAPPRSSSKSTSKSAGKQAPSAGPRVDAEYVEFTVVPVLLRSRVDYTEANKYGECMKLLSDAEVRQIMSTPSSLIEDIVKTCKINVPPNFEQNLIEDMIWKKGAGSRKSFVYYRSDATPSPVTGERQAHSDAAVSRTQSMARQRQSFSAGAPLAPVLDEGEAARYKAPTRKDKAESISKDLNDLVAELGGITPPSKGLDRW